MYSTTKKKVYMCIYYVIQWILENRGNNWSPRPHKHTKVPRSRYRLLLSLKHGEIFQSSPIFMAKDINLPIQILANLWFLDGKFLVDICSHPDPMNGQILSHSTLFPGSILVPQIFLRFVQTWILSCTIICE